MLGTIDELRLLIREASMQRPHLTSRLEKAAFLVLLRPVEQLTGSVWRVGSEDGLRYYVVKNDECECSDYVRHGRGHLCKHRIALFLRRSLEGVPKEPDREQRRRPATQDHDLPRAFAAEP